MSAPVAPSAIATVNDLYLAIMLDVERPFSRIYFARNPANNTVKIGRSGNVARRMAELRTAIPNLQLLADLPGGPQAEADLHASFRDSWVGGEWFDLTPSLFTTIVGLVAADERRLAR